MWKILQCDHYATKSVHLERLWWMSFKNMILQTLVSLVIYSLYLHVPLLNFVAAENTRFNIFFSTALMLHFKD